MRTKCKALYVILNRFDVESFWGALEQLHGSFSDFGAREDLQKPTFVMLEILIKELWIITKVKSIDLNYFFLVNIKKTRVSLANFDRAWLLQTFFLKFRTEL